MVQTALPIGTIENTGGHWTVTGAASAHEALASASDASYVSSTGSASAVLTIQLDALLRPHVRATQFDLTIRWRVTTGSFSTPPVVELMDDASETWIRVYHTASITPAVGGFVETTYAIPSNLIRGHDTDGGVRNFGDTGVKFSAPDGASGGAELQISYLKKELENVYPFSDQAIDVSVDYVGGEWIIKDEKGAIPGAPASGEWKSEPHKFKDTLDDTNVLAAAIFIAGYVPNSGSVGVVIGIKTNREITGCSIYGGTTNKASGYWQFGTVNSPSGFKRVDKLVIRSTDTSNSGRAIIRTPNISAVAPNGSTTLDLGWVSFQSVRFWRWHPKTYVFESNDNARSENALAGLYDCYFAGPDGYGGAAVTGVSSNAGAAGTATFNRFDGKTWSSAGYGPGTVVQALGFNAPTNERWTVSSVSGTTMTVTDPTDAIVTQGQSSSRSIHKAFNHECKQNIRCGYLSFDIIDCRFCSSSEHGAYHSGPRQDGQLIRTENVASSSLWPEHPSPDTVSGGVRGGRTFNQVVGRASYCAAGGHGPPAQGTWLVEDITARNYSVGNNVGTLTYVGILSDVIIRRANFIGGKGLILFWVDMGVSQSTPPASKGHHHSLGQFSGVQWTNSCSIGGGNKGAVSGAVPAPDSLPASSIAHAQGNVVIEGITGSGATTDIPIRTGGCESVTIRNCLGLLGASSKTPYIHASYWARPTTKWVWFGYGGPYRDKDFRFEVPPGETVSSYYGTATGASLSDLMAYASPSNVNNNTGGAGTGVNDARLTGDQIDSLVPGGAEWPLFAQNMDYGNPLPNSMNGKSIGGIFPSMTAPEDYGPWKDAIYDPGYNTHTPHRLEHTTGSATWGDASGVFLSSLEPVEIQIESKRGDIQFPLGLVAASPVQIEIESKRGFLASPVQLLGDSVTLEIDPPDASHILVPMGGGVSTVEIASKRGHLSFGGVSPIEMTGDPSEMLVMPAAGYIKFAPEMVSDGTIQIEIAPGGGVFGPMLLAGSVLVEVSLQSMFSNTAAPLTAGGWSGNSSKVREEFRTRVAVPYSLTVQFDNEATQAIGNQRWARAQVIHASTSRLRQNSIRTTRAGGMVRRGGLLLVQIFAPITEGDGDLLAIADFVEDSMRSTTLDGVTYHVPSTERVGRTQDGKWWQVNVQVPFSFVMEI